MLRFLLLARKWPNLMLKWQEMESNFSKYGTHNERNHLSNRIKLLVLSLTLCAIIEHALAVVHSIYYTQICKPNENQMEAFARHHLYEVFQLTSYALWKVILGEFTNVVASVTWIYINLFTIMVSIGLSSRFNQLNKELERFKGEV